MKGLYHAKWLHLTRRFFGAVSNRAPSEAEVVAVRSLLTAPEWWLWSEMAGRDRRHSLEVLARFDALGDAASRGERAAVLLHDSGKTTSSLGLWLRVMATLVGPRGERFRSYHEHEESGARRARALGVDHDVMAVLERRAHVDVLHRLDQADDL